MNKKNLFSITFVIALLLLGGCTSLDGRQLENNAYQGEFFVEHQPKDGRDLHVNISQILNERGLKASYGKPGQAPESADYVVSYLDRWYWDMRMYLQNLRIEVRDKSNSQIVGFGESGQDSLAAMGKTFEDIINRTLDQMLVEKSKPQKLSGI